MIYLRPYHQPSLIFLLAVYNLLVVVGHSLRKPNLRSARSWLVVGNHGYWSDQDNLYLDNMKPFEFDNLFVFISIIVFQFVHCDVIIPFVWKVVLLLLMTH